MVQLPQGPHAGGGDYRWAPHPGGGQRANRLGAGVPHEGPVTGWVEFLVLLNTLVWEFVISSRSSKTAGHLLPENVLDRPGDGQEKAGDPQQVPRHDQGTATTSRFPIKSKTKTFLLQDFQEDKKANKAIADEKDWRRWADNQLVHKIRYSCIFRVLKYFFVRRK